MAEKARIERAARALCRLHDVPEASVFEGKPMWMSYIPEVMAVLEAALTSDELERLIRPLDRP
ncbi:hypothetical protein FS815_24490 [Agrobacterium vitis]|uniref:hypothetical protein n=1 Tax=Allorhizobium ampelinum TaxID=3025782 RepID=UPI001F194369|nr:hypothetical protein [Allorhizobium ampelinum]MCF1449952.1 hypothetical protein [Allorhizobium ampelinum]